MVDLIVTLISPLRAEKYSAVIAVLELSETLNSQHDPDISGSDHAKSACKVRAVGSAADTTDVIELIEDEIDRYVAGA